jgi:hypothetical protein
MSVDVRQLLAAGGYQIPNDEQCTELQKYWDDVVAQGERFRGDLGPSESAVTFAPWRPEDD